MRIEVQKWVSDIESYADSIPYGRVNIEIERVDRRTTQVTTQGHETLRYVNNEECVKDILTFITRLLDVKHTGDVQFSIDMRDGNIKILTIKNTRKTNYQK